MRLPAGTRLEDAEGHVMTLVDEGEGESVGGGWIRFEDGQEYRPLVRPAPEEPEAT